MLSIVLPQKLWHDIVTAEKLCSRAMYSHFPCVLCMHHVYLIIDLAKVMSLWVMKPGACSTTTYNHYSRDTCFYYSSELLLCNFSDIPNINYEFNKNCSGLTKDYVWNIAQKLLSHSQNMD